MKPLHTQFASRGFEFSQIDRAGMVALFEQTRPGSSHTNYVVVLVQRRAERQVGGRLLPAAEQMPPAAAWGRLGWTYCTLDEARRKFDSLIKRRHIAAPSAVLGIHVTGASQLLARVMSADTRVAPSQTDTPTGVDPA